MTDTQSNILSFVMGVAFAAITLISLGATPKHERIKWCQHHFELKAEYDECVDKGVKVMEAKNVDK